MLIYTKIVDNIRKLFGNYLGNVPTDSDPELSYLDSQGDPIELQPGDTYVDGGSSDGVQKIKRLSDGTEILVAIGDNIVIGGEVAEVDSIAVKTAPTTTTYSVGDSLDLTGLVITVTYSDSSTKDLAYNATGVTCSPDDGDTLAATDTKVIITYAEKTCEQAITVA